MADDIQPKVLQEIADKISEILRNVEYSEKLKGLRKRSLSN